MILERWFGWLSPSWEWLQIEVSSQCHATCRYCPTALYKEDGTKLLMSMETYRKLSSAFSHTGLVYLQGWGEPFLNPHFFEMTRMAKTAGCKVGMTTNGMLLNDERFTEIVKSGVDIITFSLAGCQGTNDVIRKGTRLEQVLNAIQQLQQIKGQNGSKHPEIHIAYMLLRSGLEEINSLIDLLAGLDIAQVVITTLDFLPLPDLENEALIPSSQEEYACLRARLDGLAATGKQAGIEVHYQLATPKDYEEAAETLDTNLDFLSVLSDAQPTCTENIQRAAFISAGGDVSPCVFARLPVKSVKVAEMHTGKPYRFMVFGNIGEQSLEEIWKSKEYRKFRQLQHAGNLQDICQSCLKPRVRIH